MSERYPRKEKKMLKWIVRGVLALSLAAWAAFFASGCVETHLPVDGQVYLCTFRDAGTNEALFEVERCGPWDDWTVPAWELAEEYQETGAPRAVSIDCRGTRRACAWEER